MISDDGLVLLHARHYDVSAFRRRPDILVLRGEVRDEKPPGVYVAGDTRPLTIHHMVVELAISMPALDILGAEVLIDTHPHAQCPDITTSYDQLVGLSIARGFSGKVRELFGGPRGCTHTTALLLAMAPVAVQSRWSMVALARLEAGEESPTDNPQWEAVIRSSLNTCHVWAEDGDHHRTVRDSEYVPVAMPLMKRLRELGRLDPDK